MGVLSKTRCKRRFLKRKRYTKRRSYCKKQKRLQRGG